MSILLRLAFRRKGVSLILYIQTFKIMKCVFWNDRAGRYLFRVGILRDAITFNSIKITFNSLEVRK